MALQIQIFFYVSLHKICFVNQYQNIQNKNGDLWSQARERFKIEIEMRLGNWSLVIGHWSLVIGHWSLVIGHWSLAIGHWQFPIGKWQLVIGNW